MDNRFCLVNGKRLERHHKVHAWGHGQAIRHDRGIDRLSGAAQLMRRSFVGEASILLLANVRQYCGDKAGV